MSGQPILIGEGILNWDGKERRSDRYGSIHLSPDIEQGNHIQLQESLIGKKGILKVEIVETRQSRHIGDFFRGLFPETPEIGDEFILGNGTVFINDRTEIGVKPDEDRDSDWLNPNNLYKCHEQTVKLFFVPEV